jgi:hypothetical protein
MRQAADAADQREKIIGNDTCSDNAPLGESQPAAVVSKMLTDNNQVNSV